MKIIDRVSNFLLLIIILTFSIIFVSGGQVEAVTVFIIDSEIEEEYLSENAKINPDPGHGSLVSWIINKETKKYDINIIPLDVTDGNGEIEYDLYLSALREIIDYKLTYPQQKILVNISLGFSERIGYEYIKELYDNGVQFIAAAGNNNSHQPVYPAGFSREVIAVASADSKGKAESSNYGYYVDISAPGSLEYIENLYFPAQSLSRKYKYFGTSFAAPRVTALLAVLLVNKSDLTIKRAFEIIEETATPVNDKLFEKGMLGAGVMNKEAALARVVKNYHLYKYLKIAAVLALVGLILTVLWPKYKIFSFFVLLLFFIVFFPVGIIIKENIYFWLTEGRYYIYYLASAIILLSITEKILIFIVKKITEPKNIVRLLSIPFSALREAAEKRLTTLAEQGKEEILKQELLKTTNKNKKKILLRILIRSENPPLELLLNYAVNNHHLADFISAELVKVNNKEKLNRILLKYLKKDNYTAQKLAEKIYIELVSVVPELILPGILSLLKGEEDINKEIILHILESWGIKASTAVEDVKKILLQSKNMWTRYQAVRTLYSISADKGEILSFLQDFRDDEQELVKMEVRALCSREEI